MTGRVPTKSSKALTFDSWIRSTSLTFAIMLLSAAIIFILVSMIAQMLNLTGGTRIDVPEQPAVVQQKTTIPAQKPQDKILVEVLNGCGVDGVASKMREYLISRNFDVVDFKNFSSYKVPQTLVIDRTSMDTQNARKVAQSVGVSRDHVFPQISPHRKLDVTIIIGSDYKNLDAFR